jgi:hypothetical protein
MMHLALQMLLNSMVNSSGNRSFFFLIVLKITCFIKPLSILAEASTNLSRTFSYAKSVRIFRAVVPRYANPAVYAFRAEQASHLMIWA